MDRSERTKEAPNLHYISWNVNGLRACMGKGFPAFLAQMNPDVICLQEVKMERGQGDFQFPGYHEYWNSSTVKKGYSGTAVFTKVQPLSVTNGLPPSLGSAAEQSNGEGRVITCEFEDLFLVTVYTPNAQRDLARLPFRMAFEDALRAYLISLDQQKPVLLCGDLNVAHTPLDLKNPKPNVGNAGFTYEERGKFSELLAAGFVDTYRHFYPTQPDAYTWWSYMHNARANNTGWRIDYFVASQRLMDRIQDAEIYPDALGSDHCPVGVRF